MSSPNERVYELLHQEQPQQLVVVSHSTIPAVVRYLEERPCELITAPSLTPADIIGLPQQDLVVIADWLEHVSHQEGKLLLGALRNRLNPRILVALDESRTDWSFTDFIGLGFRREGRYAQDSQQLALYGYDLGNYNHKRTWNNPDNWANPQNWGKYWW